MYLLNEKIQAAFTGRDVNSPPPSVPADREEVEAATPPVLA
jgi:hypothetical protein